jgi:glycosyltransferase involved in cell wall biosynthesis
MNITWLTVCPSGDQIDLLRALTKVEGVKLRVLYCSPKTVKGNLRSDEPDAKGQVLSGIGLRILGGEIFFNPSIVRWILRDQCELFVIAGYIHPTMQLAMFLRILQGRPWALFAERPGVHMKGEMVRKLRANLLLLARHASAIIATGTLAERDYRLLCGKKPLYCSIPYLIDLDPFLQIQRSAVRKQRIRFLYCGQLIPRKGVDTLIKAFLQVARMYYDVELEIMGDGPEKERLQAMVPDEFHNRIIFAGSIPFEQRVTHFQEADALVHPARHEGWGVVIQEAMAAGLPILSTRDTEAAVTLVQDGRTGFLVPANDVETLYKRIRWFVEHPDQIVVLGQRAREDVAQYTPEWGAERLLQIARSIVG